MNTAIINDPWQVLALLLAILAVLFSLNETSFGKTIFRRVPLLVFCYFVPTFCSNFGLIPMEGKFVLYKLIKLYLLPISLFLLVLAVDLKALWKLRRHALVLFGIACSTIVIGGPLAFLLLGSQVLEVWGDQAWKGLAALSGSWIGGGANFVAIGESVGASEAILGLMVVVDVVVANIWTACLLGFADKNETIDEKNEADRTLYEDCLEQVKSFAASVARPTSLASLLVLFALSLSATVIAKVMSEPLYHLMGSPDILSPFTMTIMLVTFFSILCSLTKLRNLEGAGASSLGSVFLYLLVASIGAKADFTTLFQPENLWFFLIGGLWMLCHAVSLLVAQRWLKAPVFFMAVSSQASVGGAASAPVVASAFHPSLAPVGVVLAIFGYVVGVYGGLLCAFLLEQCHQILM